MVIFVGEERQIDGIYNSNEETFGELYPGIGNYMEHVQDTM